MSDYAESPMEFWALIQQPEIIWQLAGLIVSLVLAWEVGRLSRGMAEDAGRGWTLDMDGARQVLFPIVALILVVVVRTLLGHWYPVHLLNVAVPILGSLALIRMIFYVLRRVIRPSGVLATSERVVSTLVWGVVAMHFAGVLPDVIEILDRWALPLGKQRISLWLVLQALFWMAAMLLAALWGGDAIEARLARAETLHTSLRAVLGRIAKAALLLIAVLTVLPLLGIDLTVLSVFGGALGVGLGFGLQKVASNYICGFIILLERSVRLGDFVTADGFYGEVKGITTRHVVLRGLDGREAIIPNETLITSTVISHTHSDRRIRLAVQVQVDYAADVDHVLGLLIEVAKAHARVLADPPPNACVLRLAESGIDLEVGFWIDDPERGSQNVRSDVARSVLRALQSEHIPIPYPRRDVHIVNDTPSQ